MSTIYKQTLCNQTILTDRTDTLIAICYICMCLIYKSKEEGNIQDLYNQIPHLTQNTTWVSDENTRKHHIQESQEINPFRAGDHTPVVNRQDSMARNTNNNK